MDIFPVALGAMRQLEDGTRVPCAFSRYKFPDECQETGWPSRPDGNVRAVMEQLFRINFYALDHPENDGGRWGRWEMGEEGKGLVREALLSRRNECVIPLGY